MLQAQSDKIKLQLRVEELQHKYEPKGNHNITKTLFVCWSDVLDRSVCTSLNSPDAKKNLIQKRKKEKLPVDIAPSEETVLDKGKHVVAVEMDVTNAKAEDPAAHTSPTAETVSATQSACSGGQ